MDYKKMMTLLGETLAGVHDEKFTAVTKSLHCMSTPRVYAVLNSIVSSMETGEIYVEVGCYQGGSLISALLGNDIKAIGVDNFAEFQGTNNLAQTKGNLERFGVLDRVDFKDMGYEEFFATLPADFKIQTYFYDGAHAYEPQLAGMEIAWRHLQSGSIILVDDLLYPPVNRAINQFIANHIDNVKVLLMVDSMNDCDKVWWNGVVAIRVL